MAAHDSAENSPFGTLIEGILAEGGGRRAVIDVELTSVCNAVCSFCPREQMPDIRSFMTLDVVEALAERLKSEPRRRHIILCGVGEPTLHPELEKIVSILAATGAYLTMTTNGSRLKPSFIERLVDRGLREIYVSLNALTPETHHKMMAMPRFDRIQSDLISLLEHRRSTGLAVDVFVSMVICDQTRPEVHEFVQKWKEHGVTGVWLHPLNNRAGLLKDGLKPVPMEDLAEHYLADLSVQVDLFTYVLKHARVCKIARALDFISYDGEMRLCAMDYRRETSFGNVKTHPFPQMYQQKLTTFYGDELPPMCLGCDFCPR